MRFFSKLTFICNLCFVAYVILRMEELAGKKEGRAEVVTLVPPVQNTLIVLGLVAVFVNLTFNLILLVKRIRKQPILLPTWLVWANAVFLLVQLIYFFY